MAPDLHGRVLAPNLLQGAAQQVALHKYPGVDGSGDESVGENPAENWLPLIIKLTRSDAALPEEIVELYRRENLVLAYVPESALASLAGMGMVSRIEGGNVCTPVLDVARTFTGFPEVAEASNLPAKYTGKGVVAGFTDAGFDPGHLAFRDPVTGRSRVSRLVNYTLDPENITRLDTPTEIAAWTTDDSDMWHATHVCGIMAGGYKGNPYYGIATESDIVATTSELTNALLLAGMEEVVEYGKNVGKPVVINMSVSSAVGPHDGTSLASQYLALLGGDATICISSGNDGGAYKVWSGTFSPELPYISCGPCDNYSWNFREVDGVVEIWNSSASALQFSLIVYDTQEQKTVATIPFASPDNDCPEVACVVASSGELLKGSTLTGSVSVTLAEYFTGTASIVTEVNPDNGRFNAYIHLKVSNLPDADGTPANRYLLGIRTEGEEGDTAVGYAGDSMKYYVIQDAPKFYTGSNGSVNDFVTGEGVLGVGAMCSRNSWPLLDGTDDTNSYIAGNVVIFSGYNDGGLTRRLPDVVAPGVAVVSSISRPYMAMHPEYEQYVTCRNTSGSDAYYWTEAGGTSMSSPYVAGVCALMLEANPGLTPAEVREIIRSTVVAPQTETWNLRWGTGILDSYAAVREAVSRSGLSDVFADGDADLMGGGQGELFDLQGRRVAPGCDARGIYLERTPDGRTRKVVR